MIDSQGQRFRKLLAREQLLQIVGTINAYSALLAREAGFEAIYLSGAGVANASFGLPDLAITQLADVLEDARRITAVVDLPLLVDIDTGWGSAFNIARTIKEMINAGVAAVHLEDQVTAKRCGHRPGKQLVRMKEMQDRLKAAVDSRSDENFFIMARTDALATEGLESAIERAHAYVDAGADAIFAEACTTLQEYQAFTDNLAVPVLANVTEFGKTPLFTIDELAGVDVSMVLYPLSAWRAMNQAAQNVYQAIKSQGTQKQVVSTMQSRDALYQILNYQTYESKLDALFREGGQND